MMNLKIKKDRINAIMTAIAMVRGLVHHGNGVKAKHVNPHLNRSRNPQAAHQKITIMMKLKINGAQINAQIIVSAMEPGSVVSTAGALESPGNKLHYKKEYFQNKGSS